MTNIVRFPPGPWPEELEEREGSWDAECPPVDPLCRINPATRQHRSSPPTTSAEVIRAWELYTLQIATLRHERSINEWCWEIDYPVVGDALGVGGIELVARQMRHEPKWQNWLVMLLAPIAALCAVGWMVAVVG